MTPSAAEAIFSRHHRDLRRYVLRMTGRSGGAGVKEFVANEGETVSVELPASFGSCMVPGTAAVPPGSRPGVTASLDGLRISSREFFEGDRCSLLVSVRPFERTPR